MKALAPSSKREPKSSPRTQPHRIVDTDPERGNVVVRVIGTRHDEPPPTGGHPAVSGNFDGAGGDDIICYAPSGPDTIWESRRSQFDVVHQISI